MNKHIIVALLPFLFQNTVYSADLNAMIKTELENARKIASIHVKLELEAVLQALVAHGKKSDANSIQAVNAIKDIKNALLQYRSEQYTSNWMKFCKVFNVHPKKVSQEIDPALKKVNNALQELQANASIYGYAKAGALVTVVLAVGATAVALSLRQNRKNKREIQYSDSAPSYAGHGAAIPLDPQLSSIQKNALKTAAAARYDAETCRNAIDVAMKATQTASQAGQIKSLWDDASAKESKAQEAADKCIKSGDAALDAASAIRTDDRYQQTALSIKTKALKEKKEERLNYYYTAADYAEASAEAANRANNSLAQIIDLDSIL